MENWIAPGFGSPHTSLLLCLVVFATVAASLVWVRLPGPVTSAERARRGPGRRWALRLAGLSALAGPLIMVLSVWSLAFPLRQPVVAVLVTRSRPAGEAEAWKEKLRSQLQKPEPWGASTLDVGQLADRVCQRLGPRQDAWTDAEALGLAAAVREEIRKVLGSSRELAAARAEGARPEDFIEPAPTACRDNGLPRWLIESIEISLLRALVESVNVVELRLAGPQRKTAVGQAWDGLPESLKKVSPRSRPPEIVPLESLEEPPPLRIAAVLGPVDARGAVRCLIAVPPHPPSGARVRFRLRSQRTHQIFLSESVALTPDPAGRLLNHEARFKNLPRGEAWQISLENTDLWHPVVSSSTGPLFVQIQAPEELQKRWSKTAEVLLGPSRDPAIVEWRQLRKRYGLGRQVQLLKSGGDIVIDATRDGAVAVYPRGTVWKDEPRSPVTVKEPIVRGRVTRNALPGVYSFDALPLVGTFSLPPASQERCDAILSRQVSPSFRRGPYGGRVVPRSLVTMSRVEKGWLTDFGFSFERQGMLLGQDGKPVAGEPFDTARLLAGWTQLLAAIEQVHATSAGCEPPAQIEADPTHPVSFLDVAEQAEHRRRGTLGAVASFALGLAVYGSWLVRGLRQAPNRRT